MIMIMIITTITITIIIIIIIIINNDDIIISITIINANHTINAGGTKIRPHGPEPAPRHRRLLVAGGAPARPPGANTI